MESETKRDRVRSTARRRERETKKQERTSEGDAWMLLGGKRPNHGDEGGGEGGRGRWGWGGGEQRRRGRQSQKAEKGKSSLSKKGEGFQQAKQKFCIR